MNVVVKICRSFDQLLQLKEKSKFYLIKLKKKYNFMIY